MVIIYFITHYFFGQFIGRTFGTFDRVLLISIPMVIIEGLNF